MISGLTIGGLFALTRRAAREEQMAELRQYTRARSRRENARAAQARSLKRMRAISSAQLGSILAERGVSPMALIGQNLGTDSTVAPAYIAEAAAAPRRG